MCPGNNCPKKDICYRHIAKPGRLQSFFVDPPYCLVLKQFSCDYFWDSQIYSIPGFSNSKTLQTIEPSILEGDKKAKNINVKKRK